MNETIAACRKAAHELSMLTAKKVKPIPSGWFSDLTYAKAIGVQPRMARYVIEQLREANKLEEKNWQFLDSRGRLYSKRIYRNI